MVAADVVKSIGFVAMSVGCPSKALEAKEVEIQELLAERSGWEVATKHAQDYTAVALQHLRDELTELHASERESLLAEVEAVKANCMARVESAVKGETEWLGR